MTPVDSEEQERETRRPQEPMTGEVLIDALQAAPAGNGERAPQRGPMPVRDVSL